MAISDWSHYTFCAYAYRARRALRLYKLRRFVGVWGCFFGALWFGYTWSNLGRNLYTSGYQQGFAQPFDYSMHVMLAYGADEKEKHAQQLNLLLKDSFESEGEKLDILDWLIIGQHFAKNQEDESSFQAYYIAHLMDYDKIGTNSDLKFETNAMGDGPGAKEALAKD